VPDSGVPALVAPAAVLTAFIRRADSVCSSAGGCSPALANRASCTFVSVLQCPMHYQVHCNLASRTTTAFLHICKVLYKGPLLTYRWVRSKDLTTNMSISCIMYAAATVSLLWRICAVAGGVLSGTISSLSESCSS
jgi:hypothetical protein